jgi:hypothetical protein
MSSKEFWGHVEAKRAVLVEEHKARVEQFSRTQDESVFQGQPKHGKSVFLVSREVYGSGSKAGSVCEVFLRLAAQRLIEGMHSLANIDEISRFLALQAANGQEIKKMEDVLNKGVRSVYVRPAEPPVSKGVA